MLSNFKQSIWVNSKPGSAHEGWDFAQLLCTQMYCGNLEQPLEGFFKGRSKNPPTFCDPSPPSQDFANFWWKMKNLKWALFSLVKNTYFSPKFADRGLTPLIVADMSAKNMCLFLRLLLALTHISVETEKMCRSWFRINVPKLIQRNNFALSFYNRIHAGECTMYGVHCTLYVVHCTLYTVQCIIHSLQKAFYSAQRAVGKRKMYTVLKVKKNSFMQFIRMSVKKIFLLSRFLLYLCLCNTFD